MLASCLQLPGCCARYGVRALPLIAWSRSCTERCQVRHGAASVEVQWQRFPHASARRREPRTSTCTFPVHCWYLVLGNCTSSLSFLHPPPKYQYLHEANLNLKSCKTQQNNTRSASCIMRRLPFPPPPNLQPFQHPCAPTGAGASPHSLRLRALSRVLIGRGPGAAVPYQVPTRYLPGENLPSVPVQAPPSACIRYLLLFPPSKGSNRPNEESRVSASGRNLQPQCGLAPSRGQGIASISSLSPPASLHVLPPFCRRVTRPCPSAPLLRLSLQRRRIWSLQGAKNTPCKHKSCHKRPLTTAVATLAFFMHFFFSAF